MKRMNSTNTPNTFLHGLFSLHFEIKHGSPVRANTLRSSANPKKNLLNSF